MSELTQTSPTWRMKLWPTILLFSVLAFGIYSLGAFWLEPYSGSCMFVLPGFFYVLVTVLPILLLRRFGVGAGVFLINGIVGGVMDYFFEYVSTPSLRGPWAAIAWGLIFIGFGFTADLAFRFAPSKWNDRQRSIFTGAVMGGAMFFLVLLALSTFYNPAGTAGNNHIAYFNTSKAIFSLPWLVISGGFGGYTAYAMVKKV